MKPNTDYGVRPVSAREIASACGSARRALELTGGDETTALYLLHNPDAMKREVVKPVPQLLTGFGSDLRELRDAEDAAAKQREREALEAERKRLAAEAWKAHGSVAAVMRACGAGFDTAKKLIEAACEQKAREVQHG